MKDLVINIYKTLPKTDCGQCGLPTCLSFARAVAMKKSKLSRCIFVTSKCPKCGYTAEIPFTECPGCGLHVQVHQNREDTFATLCPKCRFHDVDNPFTECPYCGTDVPSYAKRMRLEGKVVQTQYKPPVQEEKSPPPPKPKKSKSYQCPFCGFITSAILEECPDCGYNEGPGFNGG